MAHAAQFLAQNIPCTLLPPQCSKMLLEIPVGKEKDNATRHALANAMRDAIPTSIREYNTMCPTQNINRVAFITIAFPPTMSIMETWMRVGKYMEHFQGQFEKVLREGIGKVKVQFAAAAVEMHTGRSNHGSRSKQQDKLKAEQKKLTNNLAPQIHDLITEDEMVKFTDPEKVATTSYRVIERKELIGAAHIHVVLMYHHHSNLLKSDTRKALAVPAVFYHHEDMPAGGLADVPKPHKELRTRDEITKYERQLTQKKGSAICHVAYLMKETHHKHTRHFATQIAGLGNTVILHLSEPFIHLARELFNHSAALSVFMQSPQVPNYLKYGLGIKEDGEPVYEGEKDQVVYVTVCKDDEGRLVDYWADGDGGEEEQDITKMNSLGGRVADRYALVREVIDVCKETKQSPRKVLTDLYLQAQPTVVKDLNRICTDVRTLLPYTPPPPPPPPQMKIANPPTSIKKCLCMSSMDWQRYCVKQQR